MAKRTAKGNLASRQLAAAESRLTRKLTSATAELRAEIRAVDQKLDAKIDDSFARLGAKVEATGAPLDAKIDESVARLEAKVETEVRYLRVDVQSMWDDVRKVAEAVANLDTRLTVHIEQNDRAHELLARRIDAGDAATRRSIVASGLSKRGDRAE